MNIIEASNMLFSMKGMLKTSFKAIQEIRNQFGFQGRRAFNQIEIDQESSTAKLTDKNGNCTIIDLENVEAVIRAGAWVGCFNSTDKIYFTSRKSLLNFRRIHSFVMREELVKYEGFTEATGLQIVVNHLNGDTMDNRKENLEVVTQAENVLFADNRIRSNNKTGTTGVVWREDLNKYTVQIVGKHVGLYKTFEEAEAAANQARQDELNRLQQLRLDFLKKHGFMS